MNELDLTGQHISITYPRLLQTDNGLFYDGLGNTVSIGAGSVGPQGPQGGGSGSEGPQGYQGPRGDLGLYGPQGYQGPRGDLGLYGPQGPTGSNGTDGSQGNQGFQGSNGSQGNQGLRGFQGFQGFQGLRGFQGNTGNTGNTGNPGDTGPIGPQGPEGSGIINETLEEVLNHILNSTLSPGAIYKIRGCDSSLYNTGDPTSTIIFLEALENNVLSDVGTGIFFTPKYESFPIWDSATVYTGGTIVIWGGYIWECTEKFSSQLPPIDMFTLDSTEWLMQKYIKHPEYYNVNYDDVKYDIDRDRIVYRNERNTNIVTTTHSNIRYWKDNGYENPIEVFQWGRTSNIKNQFISHSYNENINVVGSQRNIQMENLSYQRNIIIGNAQSSNSFQSDIVLSNGSYQDSISLYYDSYQQNLVFNNGSCQVDVFMEDKDSGNSNQNNLTFDNRSYQQTVRLRSSSSQENFTFTNGSNQRDIIFDNGSFQRSFNFDNGRQSGINENSGWRQTNITFNWYSYDRGGSSLPGDENGLFFIGDLTNDNSAPKIIGKLNNQFVEVDTSSIVGTPGPQGDQGFGGTNGTNGAQGFQGRQGLQGPQGFQGIQGPQGFGGTNGSQGFQGFQGTQGFQGLRGFQGFQGLQGTQGNSGISAGAIYYFNQSQTSDVSPYRVLSALPNGAQQITTVVLTGSQQNVQVSSFLTPELGFPVIPGGVQRFHAHYLKPAENDHIEAYITIQLANSAGIAIGPVIATGTSLIGWVDDVTPAEVLLDLTLPTTGIDLTNRMIAKLYISNMDSTGHTVKWYTEGNQYYTFVITTVGVIGNQGAQGSQGLIGFQGTQGTQGVQGVQGLQGFQGPQGLQGFQGSQGLQGFQGLRGFQGFQGFQGVQGSLGPQGFQGVQGPQGAIGSTGSTGTTPIIPRSFGVVFDGGGSILTAGTQADVVIPYAMTITGWTILGDTNGTAVIDIWNAPYASYPPTVANTIIGIGGTKPTLSASIKGQSTSLTSWTTEVTAGNIIRFNLDSVTTQTRISLTIQGTQI